VNTSIQRVPRRVAFESARNARSAIRSGGWTDHTSGMADQYVQGNVVILPKDYAEDFLRFCERNPKPCPLIAVGDVGSPFLPRLGRDLDIRTDLPRYRIWRDGELLDEVNTIDPLWRDDLVTFVIGCSFSFERALSDGGIPLRHIEQGRNVSMYRTNIQTVAVGEFSGPMVVSMRPMHAASAIRAVEITSNFPGAHGAPVHLGDPGQIGIFDLDNPDYGDAITILPGEIPVFWACGVTPQAALLQAKPAFCITHSPGCMLITDLLIGDLSQSNHHGDVL
jgi:uncharacterized protein YcsI (UPF0317 family)